MTNEELELKIVALEKELFQTNKDLDKVRGMAISNQRLEQKTASTTTKGYNDLSSKLKALADKIGRMEGLLNDYMKTTDRLRKWFDMPKQAQ